MMHPYPDIIQSADLVIRQAAALRSMLNEYSMFRCDEEACGCNSSKIIKFATQVVDELEHIIAVAEAKQTLELDNAKVGNPT